MKILPFIIIILLSGCVNRGIIDIKRGYGNTFHTVEVLNAGDKVKFDIQKIRSTESLQFHLCKERCKGAKIISKYVGSDFETKKDVVFTAPQKGRYYFWINDSAKRKNSAVRVVEERFDEVKNTEDIEFESGSLLTVYPIIKPQ